MMVKLLKTKKILLTLAVALTISMFMSVLVQARASDVPTGIRRTDGEVFLLTEQRTLIQNEDIGLKPINYIEYTDNNNVITFYETGDNTGEPVAVYNYDASSGTYQLDFDSWNGGGGIVTPCETPNVLNPILPTDVDTSGGQYFIESYTLDRGAPYLVHLNTNDACGSSSITDVNTVVFLSDNPISSDIPPSPTNPSSDPYGQIWYDYDGSSYTGFPGAGRYLFISPFEIIDTQERYPGTTRNVIYGITENSNFSTDGSQRLMEDGVSVYWPISAAAASSARRSYSQADYAILSEDGEYCRGGIAVRTQSGEEYGRIARVPATLIGGNSCQVIKGDPAATDSSRIEISVNQLLDFIDDDDFPSGVDVSWNADCTNRSVCENIGINDRFYGSLRTAAAFYAHFQWINPNSIRVYHRTSNITLAPITGEMVERIRTAIPSSASFGGGTTKDDLEFWARGECMDGDSLPFAILAIDHDREVTGLRDVDVNHQNMAGYIFIREGTASYRSGWNDSQQGVRCLTEEAIEDNAVDNLHFRLGIRSNISGEGGSAYIAHVSRSSDGGISDSPLDPTIPDPGADDGETVEATCETRIDNPLTWLACPLINLADELILSIERQLDGLLQIDADDYDPGGEGQFKASWSIIKNIATVGVVFTALFMVIATALDIGLFSNYTVKKYMPRLVIAVIGLQLSWVLATTFIDIVNEIGSGIEAIAFYPFPEARDMSLAAIFFPAGEGGSAANGLLFSAATGGALIALASIGLFGVLALAYTVATALLGAFIALVFRKIAVLVLLILTPLAIAAWVLPGDDALWKKWRSTFVALLLMYPALILVISFGKIFAHIAQGAAGQNNDLIVLLISVVAYVGGYFAIPLIMKSFAGAFSNITGMVNNKSKGLIDRGRNGLTQKRDQQKQWAKDRKLENARINQAQGGVKGWAAGFRTGTMGAGMGKRGAASLQTNKNREQGWKDKTQQDLYAADIPSQQARAEGENAIERARLNVEKTVAANTTFDANAERANLTKQVRKQNAENQRSAMEHTAPTSLIAQAVASNDLTDGTLDAVIKTLADRRDYDSISQLQTQLAVSGKVEMWNDAKNNNFGDIKDVSNSLTIDIDPVTDVVPGNAAATAANLAAKRADRFHGISDEAKAGEGRQAWSEYLADPTHGGPSLTSAARTKKVALEGDPQLAKLMKQDVKNL